MNVTHLYTIMQDAAASIRHCRLAPHIRVYYIYEIGEKTAIELYIEAFVCLVANRSIRRDLVRLSMHVYYLGKK